MDKISGKESYLVNHPVVPPAMELGHRSVHLWQNELEVDPWRYEWCREALSIDEYLRAGRFRFEKDRRQFVVARGLLRILLAQYLGRRPVEIALGTGPYGKPFLVPGKNGQAKLPLFFNLAHSGNRVLMAFSRDGEVGVDVEEMSSHRHPMLDMAETICTERELRQIEQLRPELAETALMRLWTAKEAFLKAMGTGFQVEPGKIEVPSRVLLGERDPVSVRHLDCPALRNDSLLLPLPGCESKLDCSAAVVFPACIPVGNVTWCESAWG